MEYKPSYLDRVFVDIQPSYTDTLVHHGIKGMHWGIRRFQNEDGTLTRAGKSRYGKSGEVGRSKYSQAAKIAGTSAAVGLAGAGAYAVSKNGLTTGSVRNVSKNISSGFPVQTTRDASNIESANLVNPNARSNKPEYLNNCMHCSMAYDLRRRGYDVEAGPGHVHTEGFIKKAYPNAEKHTIPGMRFDGLTTAMRSRDVSFKTMRDSVKMFSQVQQQALRNYKSFQKAQKKMTNAILDHCESMGPGARGAINLTFSNGMGHCIAFECDAKGRAQLIDSQLISTIHAVGMGGGHGSRGSKYVENFISNSILPCAAVSITRYDNVEPNFEYLKKKHVIVPRKE